MAKVFRQMGGLKIMNILARPFGYSFDHGKLIHLLKRKGQLMMYK